MSIATRAILSFVLVLLCAATELRAAAIDARTESAGMMNAGAPSQSETPESEVHDPFAPRQALFDTQSPRGALLDVSHPGAEVIGQSGSLFAGSASGSMFEPILRMVAYRAPDFGVVGLKNLIAQAEAGKAQYDAVVFSARIKPPKRPSEMTIGEIYDWIAATPGQNHAIGRYQIIPSTLRMLVKRAGMSRDTVYAPETQDRLALILLEDAGLNAFLAGELSQTTFMNNLAKVWAGLPTSSGKSHYEGYAGNKSVITWTTFKTAMDRYFPTKE